MNTAPKRHPNKRSKKNLDGLYEVLAPGSVVLKTDKHKSVICEPGKLDVTICNRDIAKFDTQDKRKTKLSDYINRRGPRTFDKPTEAKILRLTKEFTRIQKGDRKMKHCKRATASRISSNRSNTARAMRVRMPKIPSNFAPPEAKTETGSTFAPQMTAITDSTITAPQSSQMLFAAPPTSRNAELQLPSTYALMEDLQ